MLLAPGFVDVHVHGWGGHDAMGELAALDGMARALLRRGVTSFLPTAVTAPLDELDGSPSACAAGAAPPRPTAPSRSGSTSRVRSSPRPRRGAHDPERLLAPADVPPDVIDPLADGLRLLTIAPELPGALELIGWLAGRGIAVSLGHSAADLETARAGYAAGARSTTHLFNAMTGIDHRAPGLAVAALEADPAFVELIADGPHVHPAAVAAHRPAQARRPAAAGQRRDRPGRDGRRSRPASAASRSRSSAAA